MLVSCTKLKFVFVPKKRYVIAFLFGKQPQQWTMAVLIYHVYQNAVFYYKLIPVQKK